MGREKVVYVDFRKGRGPSSGGFGGGPRFLFAAFLVLLSFELLAAAAFYPSGIGSVFFGPTVIAVAVAGTLGVRRLVARLQVAWLYRRAQGGDRSSDDDRDRPGRTLH